MTARRVAFYSDPITETSMFRQCTLLSLVALLTLGSCDKRSDAGGVTPPPPPVETFLTADLGARADAFLLLDPGNIAWESGVFSEHHSITPRLSRLDRAGRFTLSALVGSNPSLSRIDLGYSAMGYRVGDDIYIMTLREAVENFSTEELYNRHGLLTILDGHTLAVRRQLAFDSDYIYSQTSGIALDRGFASV